MSLPLLGNIKCRSMLSVLLLFASLSIPYLSAAPTVNNKNELETAQTFNHIKSDPNLLIAFLREMPKGGDLHNHLSGAIFAESYIDWAIKDKLCLDPKSLKIFASEQGCNTENPLLKSALAADGSHYGRLIDTWSMRNSEYSNQSGHDHFFSVFGKYSAVSGSRTPDMLAEVAARSEHEKLNYLELMLTPDNGDSQAVGKTLNWSPDLALQLKNLLSYQPNTANAPPSIAEIVSQTKARFDDIEKNERKILACNSDDTKPQPAGCAVTTRYLVQISRGSPLPQVFAQMVMAFELAKADHRFVGLNLVQPEDSTAALQNFDEQMRMLNYLRSIYPIGHISLHAGELVPGLSPPESLRHHIADSVRIGHAERIGHGVDIMNEDNPYAILKEMSDRNVLVEICLSSNKTILGVQGKSSPLRTYLQYGVPVALATDDAGVSRSTISQEYQQAVEHIGVTYPELKKMARASLEHAFIEGDSLWVNGKSFTRKNVCSNTASATCTAFIQANPKARLQWQLEQEIAAFESKYSQCSGKKVCTEGGNPRVPADRRSLVNAF
ncbi:adenosine deaminase family protein [Chania multitudinisentens]|uniref:adenosine deaminase family protein n=1 Tax=Chania multitudinisentens TaxID=1639108 RepID=UPI00046339CB|nr:hypothetical protein [Chania multitudinisentens]